MTVTEPTLPRIPTNGRPQQQTSRILARSIFKDMQGYGISDQQVIEVASELIGLVTEKLKDRRP